MIRKLTFLLCTCSALATSNEFLASWTKIRLTELFESNENKDMSPFFTETAWSDFQASRKSSNLAREQDEHHYQTRITKFINPIKITPAGSDMHFAQTAFFVKFSNKNSSWIQPMELILTLKDSDGDVAITKFEGRNSKPIQVKNYALDTAKECNL